jgi:hypothetical protein
MRILLLLALLVPLSAAAAQAPASTQEALRRHFPQEHQALAGTMAGKAADEARRSAFAWIDGFVRERREAILAAPPASLLALEARQAALLRALEAQDPALCAVAGDRGFFTPAAAAAPPLPALDSFGAALVEAAAAGAAAPPSLAPPPTAQDVAAWMQAVKRIAPDVPVESFLRDQSARARATPLQLCRGAAALHEAVAALPPEQGPRIARLLLAAVIGSPVKP